MAAAMPPNQTGNASYTFASQPRALVPQRKKYREPLNDTQSKTAVYNIMHDPRVVRGTTYRSQQMNMTMQSTATDPLDLQRRQETARRQQARKRAKNKTRAQSPQAVSGRQHMEVQTELYLEELTDRVEEKDVQVQTDVFLDRPPSPLFIPAKSGTDVATQIEDGELFDFDLEVKPILEVLVGKTLEQALMEVMEEEELARLRDHQREFEEVRNSELIETQRLEENARRHREEKERRVLQQKQQQQQQKETTEKIAARSFARRYLNDLVPSVFDSLKDGGYFFDPQEREIETEFLPWLMDRVTAQIEQHDLSRDILDELLRQVVKKRVEAYAPPPAAAPAAAAAAVAAEVQDEDEGKENAAAPEPAPTPAAEESPEESPEEHEEESLEEHGDEIQPHDDEGSAPAEAEAEAAA